MASLAFESRQDFRWGATELPAEIGIDRALAAVQRLAGATAAGLLGYDRGTGSVEAIAGTALDSSPAAAPLLAAMKAETAFLLGDTAPRWIAETEGANRSRLLIKLLDRPASTLFLLLTLADGSAVARARVMRLVSDLVLLIRFHAGLDARVRDTEELRDAAAEALDHGECGVIAVRADHSIVFANAAATAHLAEEVGLRLRRGVLRPADHAHAIRFEAALDSVIDPPRGERAKRARANVMLLAGKSDARPTIIVIAPAGAAASGNQARGAAAIVYVLQPAQGVARGLDTLCQLHGLSRVESRLIAHLIGGLTLTEAATEMRVKIETARAYLKQIFAKTGMHRQTDLVALMTRYLRAIRGDFDFQPA